MSQEIFQITLALYLVAKIAQLGNLKLMLLTLVTTIVLNTKVKGALGTMN